METMGATLRSHVRDLDFFQAQSWHAANDDLEQARGRRCLAACRGNASVQILTRAPRADGKTSTSEVQSNDNELVLTPSKTDLSARLAAIAEMASSMFTAMRFDFLYDPMRQLFSIGYRVEEAALDPSFYDLLASEARLASFIAIAKRRGASQTLVPARAAL